MGELDYLRPKTLNEAFNVIEQKQRFVKFVAGGTNVIPDMRAKLLSPRLLIDLSQLKGLSYIKKDRGTIRIGALTTISELASSEIIQKKAPILSTAAHQLGNVLTRNRATIGGNLAYASPAADMAPPLLALGAKVHTRRCQGRGRVLALDKFFIAPNQTVLGKDEIIIQISFLVPKAAAKGGYIKLGMRNSMAISIASVAVMLELKRNVCQKSRISLGAVAPTPVRAYRVETNLEGKTLSPDVIQECSALITKEISPISDIRATAEYRKLVAPVMFRRAVLEALRRDRT